MYAEIRLLVSTSEMYILGAENNDSHPVLCGQHIIGAAAIAFANADLSHLEDLGRFKQDANNCVTSKSSGYNSIRFQSIIMELIQLLDSEASPFWLLEVERCQLQEIEWEIDRAIYRETELLTRFNKVVSQLESLVPFQKDLKKILFELSLSEKQASGHASSAQILRRLFKEFPYVCNLCFGLGGYMVVDIDANGKVRTEMLDRNMANKFLAILSPNSEPLEYNNIKDCKAILEYHVLSDTRMYIAFDLIERLRRSTFFARCATCGAFFFTSDKRLIYCSNTACSSNRSHIQRLKEKIHDDPALKEAYQYKNTMASRYQRTVNNHMKVTRRSVSREEYDAWTLSFHNACAVYKQEKAEAILRCASREELNEIRTRFLNRIRPEGYTPHAKKQN